MNTAPHLPSNGADLDTPIKWRSSGFVIHLRPDRPSAERLPYWSARARMRPRHRPPELVHALRTALLRSEARFLSQVQLNRELSAWAGHLYRCYMKLKGERHE